MLLITFHGGSGGVNNIYGYSTKDGSCETENALHGLPSGVTLSELRAIALYGPNLYVVSGAEKDSYVLAFKGPPKKGPEFDYLSTVIGYGQSIVHPFGIAFDPPSSSSSTSPSSPTCYVSNQDTNVVAQVNLKINDKGVSGTLGSGCQSKYLKDIYHNHHHFLDGTFVASQLGNLVNVQRVAPDVSEANGGLGVTGTGTPPDPVKPSNSVRGVATGNGILFVCDEVDSQINMYKLSDGTFLGATPVGSMTKSAPASPAGSATKSASNSPTKPAKKSAPTHISVNGDGVWVSADACLYWSALPDSHSGASLSFQSIALEVPAKNKIGGISFDDSGSVYVVFQDGTGGTGKGSIEKYTVKKGTPPTLSNGTSFAKLKHDTPEFCLWVSDSHWSG